MPDTNNSPPIIEWGWAGAALERGESGDLHVVVLQESRALLSVIDGLGHGPEAALAAREAAAILQAPAGKPLLELLEMCHEGLRKTRGVVMSLVWLDAQASTLDWCGVGNVEATLFRAGRPTPARDALATRGGVVGYRLPPMKVRSLSISRGDVVILSTDGIESDFTAVVDLEDAPQFIADTILARYAKSTDDALVLVARYLGLPK